MKYGQLFWVARSHLACGDVIRAYPADLSVKPQANLDSFIYSVLVSKNFPRRHGKALTPAKAHNHFTDK